MEIKDAIISTLAEIENIVHNESLVLEDKNIQLQKSIKPKSKEIVKGSQTPQKKDSKKRLTSIDKVQNLDEIEYLKSVRERMLVLFEGLQAPNNQELESKVTLVLNFMEYQLSTIDERLSKITKG